MTVARLVLAVLVAGVSVPALAQPAPTPRPQIVASPLPTRTGHGRQRRRRRGLARGRGRRRLPADDAGRGSAGVREHGGAHRVHRRHALHRRGLLRPDAVGDHRVRGAARCAARRQRQRPDHPRHVPRSAERVRVRDQPQCARVRRPGHQRRPGRQHRAGRRAGRVGRRIQLELGRVVDGAHVGDRHRVERGVRDSLPDAALPRRRRAAVGHQRPADDPPAQRGRVLVAAVPPVHAVPSVAGGHGHRPRDSRAAKPEADAVRAGPLRSCRPHRAARRRRAAMSAAI